MFKSFSKELVLSGCSMVADYVRHKNERHARGDKVYLVQNGNDGTYAKHTWNPIPTFETLPYLMAKELNLKPVDFACPGSGNLQIYNKLTDYIIQNSNKIGLVVACWTAWTRMDFAYKRPHEKYNSHNYENAVYSTYEDNENNKMSLRNNYEVWKQMYSRGFVFPEKDVGDFIRYSIMLDTLCEHHGIECIQAASIQTHPYDIELIKKFIGHPMFSKVNVMNFYGWPIFKDLGGINLAGMIYEEKYRVHPMDSHPNKEAHQMMCNNLIEFMKERGLC